MTENVNLIHQASVLRRMIKNGTWSNSRIARMFNDLIVHGYKQGYNQAIADMNKLLEEGKYRVNQESNSSDNVDGVQLQSPGAIDGGSTGSDADHANDLGGIGSGLSTTAESEMDGPKPQRTLWNTLTSAIVRGNKK